MRQYRPPDTILTGATESSFLVRTNFRPPVTVGCPGVLTWLEVQHSEGPTCLPAPLALELRAILEVVRMAMPCRCRMALRLLSAFGRGALGASRPRSTSQSPTVMPGIPCPCACQRIVSASLPVVAQLPSCTLLHSDMLLAQNLHQQPPPYQLQEHQCQPNSVLLSSCS